MPAWWVPILAGIAAKGVSQFFPKKQETSYEMSPEERRLYNWWMQEAQGAPPSYVTAPFAQARKNVLQQAARQPGLSGRTPALLSRIAGRQSEAVGAYRRGIMGQATGLVGGRGTRTTTAPGGGFGGLFDILGEEAGDYAALQILLQVLGEGEGGGGVMPS
jgi:hypothetical protein